MKNKTIQTLSLVLLAVIISSCAKSSKGKLANDWKMISLEEKWESKSVNGDRIFVNTIMTENTVNSTSEYYPATGTSETSYSSGIVNYYNFIIEKDGTWSCSNEVVYPSSNGSSTTTIEESGTWSFVRKTKGDDFKKRERVLFNILESSSRYVQVVDQAVVGDNTDRASYISGEKILIYTIKSSSKKQLELEKEVKAEFSSDSLTGMNSSLQKIILSGK
ncbi:hypothetical protein D3C87_371080 [compost metagenome]